MPTKATTLVLLASLLTTSAIWASDMQEDLSLKSSSSSLRASLPLNEEESTPLSSSSVKVITGLDDLEVEGFTLPNSTSTLSLTYEELKDYDLNGSKYIGQKVKTLVEEKIPGGKTITQLTAVAAQALGAETLTEGVLNAVRKSLKIQGEYPETTNGIIGQKAKKAVELIPGGEKVTAITGMIGQKLFGTPTLTEGLLNKFGSASSTVAEEVVEPSEGSSQETTAPSSNEPGVEEAQVPSVETSEK